MSALSRRRFLNAIGVAAAAPLLQPAVVAAKLTDQNPSQNVSGRPAWRQSTFIEALVRLLSRRGHRLDYVDLMGASGMAFSVRFARSSVPDICGGRLHPGISTDGSLEQHLNAVLRLSGSTLRVLQGFPPKEADAEKLTAKALEAGGPFIALNVAGGTDWCLVSEPTHTANTFVCETAFGDITSKLPADVWALQASEYELPAPLFLQTAIDALTPATLKISCRANWIWHYQPTLESGLRAYDAWLDDLNSLVNLPKDQALMYWQGQATLYHHLFDARRAAQVYLERLAASQDGRAAGLLRQASDEYRHLTAALAESWAVPYLRGGYRHPNGWRIEERLEDFNGASIPRYDSSWTTADRRKATRLIGDARTTDQRVLRLLLGALDL